MLSNAYFLAKFRFDTAENEPAKNLQNFANFPNFANFHPPNKRTNAWTRPLWQSRGRSTPSAYEYRESQRIISRQESKHQRQASWGSTHLKTSTPQPLIRSLHLCCLLMYPDNHNSGFETAPQIRACYIPGCADGGQAALRPF